MRTLFWKIFVWFWLAMFLVGLAMFLVTVASAPTPLMPPQRGFVAATMETQAARAATVYRSKGRAALDDFLHDIESKVGGKLYFFDVRGRELRAGKSTPEIRHVFRAALRQSGAIVETSGPDLLAAHRTRQNGQTFVLVGVMPRALLNAARLGWRAIPPRTRALRVLTLLLVTGLVCYGLARSIASPVAALRAATQKLAAGDLSTRVAPRLGKRRDELAQLGRDFDLMAERIGALLSSQQQLRRDVSHELRSPLARLRLALALARRDQNGLITHLDRIEREAENLDALIGQLLTLDKLESGATALRREPVDLRQLLNEIVADADFEAAAQNKRVLFAPDDTFQINGDAALLRSAIENVVRNAIRHTHENSTVEISLEGEREAVALTVCDEGDGVPESALPRLFEPFYRVEEARDHASGGAGLGLAIARRAVESHGGTIAARNRETGGLCIEMRLPLESNNGF